MLVLPMRAALLDGRIYREIGEEPAAMFRALGTVLAAAIAFGLGLMSTDFEGFQDSPTQVFLVASTTMVLGWLLWGTIAYIVGSRALGGQATHRMLLRSLGIAYAPGIVMVLAGTPGVGGPVSLFGPVWLLASGRVAIRETLGHGSLRALLPSLAGWFVAIVVVPVVFLGPRVSSGG